MNSSSIIHDHVCSLCHTKCHPKSYHSDITYHTTLNIIVRVMSQLSTEISGQKLIGRDLSVPKFNRLHVDKNWIEIWVSRDLVTIIKTNLHVCGFLNWIHKVLPIVFTIDCEVVKFQRCSPLAFKHLCVGCLFFDPHLITHQSNMSIWLRKVIKKHPHT